MTGKNRYSLIIEKIFFSKFKPGTKKIDFSRDEFIKTANELNIEPPKNLGDIIYSFRYRAKLPQKVNEKAGEGNTWIIRPAGLGKYQFALVKDNPIIPNRNLVETKVPDSTPGIVDKYALSDEQALLAKIRYNRLIDIFSGVACYSLQNHLRTNVKGMGQVETDEIYVGIDKKGAQYIFPVQAKGGRDMISIVQIEQDIALCNSKFPQLICRPIAAQFMQDGVISLFEFEAGKKEVGIGTEKHYRLVSPEEISDQDLEIYRKRTMK